jgi:carboxyl-terminal processing protease
MMKALFQGMKLVLATMAVAAGLTTGAPRLLADTTNGSSAPGLTNGNGSVSTNGVARRNIVLAPGHDDPFIAQWVARILARSHYLQKPLDDEISAKFLEQYLDAFDPQHLIFFASDIKEFDSYRTRLDDLTLRTGDTTPAYVIFKRFLERFDQQVALVDIYLKTNRFDFTGNDLYPLNRREAPRPADRAAAEKLWEDRVRFEYLQEKLNRTNQFEFKDVPSPSAENPPGRERVEKLASAKSEPIEKIISRRYARIQRFLKEYEPDDVLQVYLTALAHVYDPHSDYMGRAQLENFSIGMKLSLFGIGALLRSEDGYCKIQELIPEGPAEKSKKIKPNDKIIAVAQGDTEPVEVVDWKLDKVVELIRGAKGTEVRLTILPADATDPSQRRVIRLIRDEIKLEEQAAKAKIIDLPGTPPTRLGVIDLPSFYSELPSKDKTNALRSTTTDVRLLLDKLKQEKVSGLILDLRRNGGGALDEAIKLTGLFIRKGPVVQVRDPDGTITVEEDPDPEVVYEGPLAVLTSRFSASASEILAGALQDYGRALIVGDSSTHGKGTVQQLLQLKPIFAQFGLRLDHDPGALKYTIRMFFLPKGASTQMTGVVPDLVLPSVNNYAEVGEGSLPNALPAAKVESAPFEPVNQVRPYLEELRKRSAGRVATDPDFAFLQRTIELYRKTVAEKTVSLNEAQRRQEKEENDARQKARKQELRDRPDNGEKAYEITLKQVSLAGLPPPMSKTNHVENARLKAPLNPDDPEAVTEDDNLPVVDITLDETKRVLRDYIGLTQGKPLAQREAAGQ